MSLPPLVAHVVYRFDTGGLENGIVNLINHMDPAAYRHAVVALTEVTDFAQRIRRPDVTFISLRKPPGPGWRQFRRWHAEIARLKPDILHTRNLGALEMQAPAAWAGIRARIHGEHGRDMSDPDGSRKRYQWVRRIYSPFVHRYIALSQDLAGYLTGRVGIAESRVTTLCNGVDVDRFSPPHGGAPQPIAGCPFDPRQHFILGTVGRLQPEKDQLTLVRAFALATAADSAFGQRARLVLVGQGPQRAAIESAIAQAGLGEQVWLAGEHRDVPSILRSLHAFCLPSRAEGISNTLLEAMATGLPVVATAVGGNGELVEEGVTGCLVPAADPAAMSSALVALLDPLKREAMAHAARARAVAAFSLQGMVDRYRAVYDEVLSGQSRAAPRGVPATFDH